VDAELADDFCTALETLCGGSTESRWGQWLHPPVAARVTLVRRLVHDAALLRRSRLNTNRLAAAIVICHLSAAVLAFCG
jgi:hypothetical protein